MKCARNTVVLVRYTNRWMNENIGSLPVMRQPSGSKWMKRGAGDNAQEHGGVSVAELVDLPARVPERTPFAWSCA
eukprot:scaffold144238_cov17-Tisochrysis_lutea.AAC.1